MELKIFNFEIIRYGSLVCMCTPLVKILIQSLKEQFQKVLSNSDYAIATSLHPQFRLSMMTIEDENDEDSFIYKGMQQTVKAKVVNLLREKLEAQEQQDVSDGGSDMDENEHSDELFDFLFKGSNETCRDSAVKIFDRGGVLEDVLGLEDIFSSPWPWPRTLGSLASNPQVVENCPVLGSRTALFFVALKTPKTSRKIFFSNTFFVFCHWRSPENVFIIIINGQRCK